MPRPVEFSSHLLTLLDRDQEAVELLTRPPRVLSAVRCVADLHILQMELKQYDRARESLDRWLGLLAAGGEGFCEMAGMPALGTCLPFAATMPAAIRHAEASGEEFFKAIAQRLAEPARHGTQADRACPWASSSNTA